MRQAWDEKVRLVLVLNKIDRLITELQLSPMEAYKQMHMIIEQVNAILSSFISSSLQSNEEKKEGEVVDKELEFSLVIHSFH